MLQAKTQKEKIQPVANELNLENEQEKIRGRVGV